MRPIPTELQAGPFLRSRAKELGLTKMMFQTKRLTRIYPRVWRASAYEMTDVDWRVAAQLAMPDDAHLTGISRIQALGLDFGPRLPVRFVVEGDLHLAFDNVFLHRTALLPPLDDVGVTPAAAFLSYVTQARVIDAIKVGDWLLHHHHMSLEELRALALAQQWRDGAVGTLWILDHLDERSRSLKESETRAILNFAGLPHPEVNHPVDVGPDAEVIGDLVYVDYDVVVEYEGGHHQTDRDQYGSDLDRYALLRDHHHAYLQVTKEKLDHPRSLVGSVHRALVLRGYDGPPPHVGELWRQRFCQVSNVVGPRPRLRRSA